MQEDTFLQALADGGFQVGELAKRLYPEGIEAKGNAEAQVETAELLTRIIHPVEFGAPSFEHLASAGHS